MARVIPIEEAARCLGLAVEEAEALARTGGFRVWRLWGRRFVDPREIEAAPAPGGGDRAPSTASEVR